MNKFVIGDILKAREKLRAAESESDLMTEDGGNFLQKRIRKRNRKFIDSSSDDSECDDNRCDDPFKKCLPAPPSVKKTQMTDTDEFIKSLCSVSTPLHPGLDTSNVDGMYHI